MDRDEPLTQNVTQRGRFAAAAAVVASSLIVWVAAYFPEDPEVSSSDPAAAGVAGLNFWLAEPPPALQHPRELLARKAGGERVLRVLEAPDRASAHLVREAPGGNSDDLEVVDSLVPVGGPTLARLATTLADPASYQFVVVPGCGTTWHVRLRLEKGDDVVDVLICFRCSQIKLLLAGQTAGWLQFGPGRAQFAELAREMFPKDASLRAW